MFVPSRMLAGVAFRLSSPEPGACAALGRTSANCQRSAVLVGLVAINRSIASAYEVIGLLVQP